MNLWDEVVKVEAMALVRTKMKNYLMEKLTVVNSRENFEIPLTKDGGKDLLWIPRGLVNKPAEDAGWKSLNVKHKITLRDNQKPLVEKFINYIEKTHPNGGIISAATGTGKTIIGIYLACYLNLKTLIIVPNEVIMNQWIERIKQFTNCNDVGVIRGYKCDYQHPFTVAMLHTICKDRFDFLEKEFGIVIYDEVHTISTQYFNTVAGKFHSKVCIGLSATPTRKDGTESVFIYHIGKVCAADTNLDAVPRVVIVKYRGLDSSTVGCRKFNGDLNLGKFYNKLVNLRDRNLLIAKIAKEALNNNHRILILTERLKHIDVLKKILNGMGINGDTVGILTADTKEIDKPLIIGTYGSAGLGLDIPDLSCLILAMPRTDVKQAAGRVTRAKARTPIIVDIFDTKDPIMRAWYQKRLNFYTTITEDINYE